jgi:hypothetical protein
MTRRSRIPVAVVLVVVGVFQMTGPAAASRRSAVSAFGARAMWLWTRPPNSEVISWATRHGVREIFASVNANTTTTAELSRLADLKRRADKHGIRLAALGGDPGWTSDPAAARDWQRVVEESGLFSAQHIDVEPYTQPAWTTNRAASIHAYLSLLTDMRSRSRLPLEVDVPFWYGAITVDGRNLADETLRRADAVTVMTYRNTATGEGSIIDVGADMLARATRGHKPIRFAAETQPLPDCAYCTFYGQPLAAMTTSLATVDSALRGHPNFAGIAIDHYESWKAMRR